MLVLKRLNPDTSASLQLMFQRTLICTDFSDGLQRLVDFVPSLVASGIRHIVFLHIVPLLEDREIPRVDTEAVKQARDRLSVALENVPSGAEVKVEVESGRPIDNILKVATAHASDLIILGMNSRSLLNEKLFGSTTMGLCQRLMIPVMTLRPQLISTYTVEELDLRCRHLFRYLLLPYDGSEASNYLVQRVKEYAEKRSPDSLQQCMLCWILDDAGRRSLPREYQVEVAHEKLAAVKADLEKLDLQVAVEVRQGNPVLQILDVAQVFDISAIATSSGSLGKLMEWTVPSFTGEVLRRSWHPVIYFPPQRK